MSDQEQFLSEALQKTSQIVEIIEDRYREAAFPIILQGFIGILEVQSTSNSNGANRETRTTQTTDSWVPITMSVNEFFRRVNPDTHPARFVTAAYYLLHAGNAEEFNQADILEIYRKLRQPTPKNSTDVMNQCIRKAHLVDVPGKDKQKCWSITPDGERYVEGLLNDNSNGSNTITK
jgi:hypothetical protein